MVGTAQFPLRLAALAIVALLAWLGLTAVEVAVSVSPAQAQFFDDGRYPRYRQARPSGGGFFQRLFGPFTQSPPRHYEQGSSQQSDSSRAPPPRKAEDDVTPTTSIVVLGDGMADWLAYGLEEAFSDATDVGVVREIERNSGLIHYDRKGDLDWWNQAREILANQKADYVVFMLGINDRQSIRERDVIEQAEKEAEEKQKQAEAAAQRALENAPGAAPDNAATDAEKQDADNQEKAENADQEKTATESKKRKVSNAVFEFRSDQWNKVYARRIDRTIAALKSKGVPVFWVGLPSIRGTRSTADAVYLNDLFRARAERAGIVYIDVWDGFVDEAGKYSSYGPDYEGQTRRLRSGDGVYFTKYGARKLAHYVEREIRRLMNNRTVPMALPTGPLGPRPDGTPGTRPVAGPVIPLTVTPLGSEALAGAPGRQRVHGDTLAVDALVRGAALSAPPGRADDFSWPPGSASRQTPSADEKPTSPAASDIRNVPPLAAVPGAATAPAATRPPGAPPPGLGAAPATPAAAAAPTATRAPAAAVPRPERARAAPQADTKAEEAASAEEAAVSREATTAPGAGAKPEGNATAAADRPAELRPPQPVQNNAPRQARRTTSPLDALFGRNGPFGWIPR